MVPQFSLLSIMACTNVPGPISTLRPDPPRLPQCPLPQPSFTSFFSNKLLHGGQEATVPAPHLQAFLHHQEDFLCLSTFGPEGWFCVGLGGKPRPCTHALQRAHAQSSLSRLRRALRSAFLPQCPRWPRAGLTWILRHGQLGVL